MLIITTAATTRTWAARTMMMMMMMLVVVVTTDDNDDDDDDVDVFTTATTTTVSMVVAAEMMMMMTMMIMMVKTLTKLTMVEMIMSIKSGLLKYSEDARLDLLCSPIAYPVQLTFYARVAWLLQGSARARTARATSCIVSTGWHGTYTAVTSASVVIHVT